MPVVKVGMKANAALQTVYELVKDFESFASFMPNVHRIEIKERSEGYVLSAWEVSIVGRQLIWTQRDEFDDENFIIRYRQVEGKLAKFEGEWRFQPVEDGVQVSLVIEFDLGKPTLAALFNPVLTKAIEENAFSMLHAIKEKTEREGV